MMYHYSTTNNSYWNTGTISGTTSATSTSTGYGSRYKDFAETYQKWLVSLKQERKTLQANVSEEDILSVLEGDT